MAIAIDVANVGEFASDTAGSTVALTTGTTVSAGATIIVTGTLINPQTVSSVADNGPGLSWTVDKQGQTGASNGRTFLASAYAAAGMASGTTITATFSASTSGARSITATSFTGVLSASPLDTTSGPLETAGTGWTTPSTSILAGSLLIACSCDLTDQQTSTVTAPSIETHDLGDAGGFSQTTCYRIESSAGSYTVAGTWTGGFASGSVCAAAYKEAPPAAEVSIAWISA